MFEKFFGNKKEAPAEEAGGGGGVAEGDQAEGDRVYAVDPKTGVVHMGEEGESERKVAEDAREDFGKGE